MRSIQGDEAVRSFHKAKNVVQFPSFVLFLSFETRCPRPSSRLTHFLILGSSRFLVLGFVCLFDQPYSFFPSVLNCTSLVTAASLIPEAFSRLLAGQRLVRRQLEQEPRDAKR
jgi:hypothetical protein